MTSLQIYVTKFVITLIVYKWWEKYDLRNKFGPMKLSGQAKGITLAVQISGGGVCGITEWHLLCHRRICTLHQRVGKINPTECVTQTNKVILFSLFIFDHFSWDRQVRGSCDSIKKISSSQTTISKIVQIVQICEMPCIIN